MKKNFLDMIYEKVKDKELYGDTHTLTLSIGVLSNIFYSNTKYIYEKYGLIQSEIDVLITLYTYEGLTAAQTSQKLIFTSGGISKVMTKLKNKGLIYKKESKEDKRSSLLYITQEGKNIVENTLPLFKKHEENVFKSLDKDEKELLERCLKKVLYSLAD